MKFAISTNCILPSFLCSYEVVINVGAVAGCIVIPVVARSSITVAYMIPFVLLLVAVLCFVTGSNRYVAAVPGGHSAQIEDGNVDNVSDKDKPNFADVAKICALIIPFNIVYSQCPTTFMVQGGVMDPLFGFIEAPSMDILDSVSVLVSGYFVSTFLYPFLARRNIKLATGYKFALGSAIGALAVLWSLLVESLIHREYARTGGKINVLWQAPCYILIGMHTNLNMLHCSICVLLNDSNILFCAFIEGLAEIFSISTAYEVAFTASPPNKKAFACAFNLFCIGGVPNMVSLGLYRMCETWFQNNAGHGNIGRIKDYSEAHVAKYFWVLCGIVMLGVFVNLLPPVRKWIAFVEDRAARAASSSMPSTPKLASTDKAKKNGENEPLLKAKKHIKYLEEGTQARIYRANTIKAEYTRSKKRNK